MTSSVPYFAYGPTVVATTLVREADSPVCMGVTRHRGVMPVHGGSANKIMVRTGFRGSAAATAARRSASTWWSAYAHAGLDVVIGAT